MERMKQLQECRDDEEASQEEMATRFEREKTESMLVVTAEDEDAPSRDISRHFEDPSYGYKEFSRRGEQVPTLRVQVRLDGSRRWDRSPLSRSLTALFLTLLRTTAGRTTASPWSTDSTPMSDRCWTRSSSWLTTSPTTPWRRTKTWTPACCAEPSGTTSTACSASGQFPNSSQVTGSRVGCACCLTAPCLRSPDTTTTITGRSTSSWTVALRSTSRLWCAVRRRPPDECMRVSGGSFSTPRR